MTEEKKKKPKYSIWQNTCWMVRLGIKYQWQVPMATLLTTLTALLLSLTELYIAPIILEQVEASVPLGTLLRTILLFTLMLILCTAANAYLKDYPSTGKIMIRINLHTKLLRKVMMMSYPLTEDPTVKAHRVKAMDACAGNESATEAIWRTLYDLLRDLFGFIIYLTLLTHVDPFLVIFTLITSVVGYFVTKRSNEWGYRHQEEEQILDSKLGYMKWQASDRKLGKDVRLFGMGPWLKDIYAATMLLWEDFSRRENRAYLVADIVELFLSLARNGLAYWYLISMTLRNGLSAPQFLLYFTAIGGFTAWVTGILRGISLLHRNSLEISLFREFLDLPEPFAFEEGKPLPIQTDGAYTLELKDVTFRYPGAQQDTIKQLNLTIPAGEKLAIVGLNGAGKTTLVKLLCGLHDPTEGQVLLNGEDIRQYNRRDYYKHFSAVFQQFSLLDVTVSENVAQDYQNIDLSRVKDCLDKAGLTEKILSLPYQYDTHLGRSVYSDGVELSGGETQRLLLARALYKNAPIIVLDEPTAALDPLAEHDIYMKYDQMTAGRSAVYISHRLASTRFCDRIIFLENGMIVEEGTHESLLAKGGKYAELFAVQSKHYQEGGNYHDEV